jgi:nicotinamidase-related amidase
MTTAVLTNECQRGAIGDLALWPALAESARPMIAAVARLLEVARAQHIPVVHYVVERPLGDAGSPTNAPLFRVANREGGCRVGTPQAELVPELGPQAADVSISKHHGIVSLAESGVDKELSGRGVDEIVLVGVSANLAIPSLAFEAVGLGYGVTIPRDGIAGVPPAYADDVVKNTLSLIASLTTVDDLISRWQQEGS